MQFPNLECGSLDKDAKSGLNKSGCNYRLRPTIKTLDCDTLRLSLCFITFILLFLICVRLRYLRVRSLPRAPPTA